MSRIHDALKKAEEERGLATPAATGPSDSAWTNESFPVQEPVAMSSAAPEPVFAPPPPIHTVLETCAVHTWSPDTEKMLFMNSNGGVAAEQFRSLRTRLYRIRQKQPLNILLVSSAVAGEGKTFVSANLAQAFVRQHGRKVLVIDADLRHPCLHKAFGAPSTPGLSEYLRGQADEFAIVQRGSTEGLYLIPSGALVTNPTELLGNGRLRNLLQRLAPLFEWVVMDSPPVLPVSDSVMLSDMSDGVLLVLRSALTPLPLAQKAQQELRNRPLLGVVLNCAEAPAAYGKYYQYGAGHSQKEHASDALVPKS